MVKTSKTCKLCNLEKPLNAFYSYRNPQSDGVVKSYMSYCKCCDKKRKPKARRVQHSYTTTAQNFSPPLDTANLL